MDDLWGNVWGGTDDHDRIIPSHSSSEKPRNDDIQEGDLSMPSWSTGPGIQWDEPSDTQSPLWSNVHHTTQDLSLKNPYADILLGNSLPTEPPADTGEFAPEPESPSPSLPPAQSDDICLPYLSKELEARPPIPSAVSSPESSPPSSPDAFGTFTAGTEHSGTTPFTATGPSLIGQLDDNEWGSPWRSVPNSADVGDAQQQHASDEWESAKLKQLEMDRKVPPELLANIIQHLEELTKDAWPENQDFVEEHWQRRWHSGMDIDGLDSILLRYIPALTLPQHLPSGRSFTAKAMADAVKLSRSTALARTSPMSTFLAAKGSTAWETSVKSRLEASVDEVPLGWRILEKDLKKDVKAEERVKKPAGLLAGLWSRRASSSPIIPPSQEQNTPPLNVTEPESASSVQTQSQRPSMDGITPPSGTPPTSQTLPEPFPAHAPTQDEDTHLSPPGSAVSRFLQRFSRPRSSPRNSLALSSDDLEYLSDVRSNSADPAYTVDGLIVGLESATVSTERGSLYGKLPPPLPPPPSVSHGVATPVGGDSSNGNPLTSPNDPHANFITDPRNITEPTISALTLLKPSPITVIDSLQPVSPNSALSDPSPTDKTTPSLSTSLLPLSSSRPSPAMSSPSITQSTQPQHRLPSGRTTQSFDDDDFSDFRSSPMDPPFLPLNISLPSSDQGKVSSTPPPQRQLNSTFNDFIQLMSSPTTGPLNHLEEPDAPRPFDFASPDLSVAASPPRSREPAPIQRISLDSPDISPTDSRSDSQRPTSPPKVRPASPKQRAITQRHQRTQSLLDLAAARPGRWPAPLSPLPEPLQPPSLPPVRSEGEGMMNVDYFGTTPKDESFTLPPTPPEKASLFPPLGNTMGSSRKVLSSPNVFDAIAQPRSGSPSLTLAPPPPGISARRALSPPPPPAAVMNRSPSRSSSSSTPVPLLPPPSSYRFAASPKPSPAQFSPESTPLAMLIGSDKGKNVVGLPALKATPPPAPVKGTGGLSAQDLSFFEGL